MRGVSGIPVTTFLQKGGKNIVRQFRLSRVAERFVKELFFKSESGMCSQESLGLVWTNFPTTKQENPGQRCRISVRFSPCKSAFIVGQRRISPHDEKEGTCFW